MQDIPKRFAKFCINTFIKMHNLRIKLMIKVIKNCSKIDVKCISMTKASNTEY